MKFIAFALGVLAMLIFSQCGNNSVFADKEIVVKLYPYDAVSGADLQDVKEHLEKYFDEINLDDCRVEIEKEGTTYDITGDCLLCDAEMGYPPTRLRADTMVNILKSDLPEYNIGITDRDISCSVHGVKDFGVLGLSFLGYKKNASMISTYRIKDKKDLWKVVAHEFTHGFFSMGHCKNNDPDCLMQDANKRPKLGRKEKLCDRCMAELQEKKEKSVKKWMDR